MRAKKKLLLDECLYKIQEMESKNELKEIDIKNRLCFVLTI